MYPPGFAVYITLGFLCFITQPEVLMSCEEKQTALTSKFDVLMGQLKIELEAVGSEAEEKAKEIDPDINTDGPDVWIGADIDIQWKRLDFSLDLPQITLKEQRWSFDVPKVEMKNKDIIFHTLSVRMERKKVGEYPEFYCNGFPPKCTVRWSPIWADVPVTFPEEQRIVLSVPEFRMERIEFVWSLPEFKMVTQELTLDVPQVTVKNISVEAQQAKEEGEQLATEISGKTTALKDEFKARAKMEHGWEVSALFECYQTEFIKQRDEGLLNFNSGISMMQGSLTAMSANKVPSDHENYVMVSKQLDEMTNSRNAFLKAMEENIANMDAVQKSFVENMFG
jgi:hypothetical protein